MTSVKSTEWERLKQTSVCAGTDTPREATTTSAKILMSVPQTQTNVTGISLHASTMKGRTHVIVQLMVMKMKTPKHAATSTNVSQFHVTALYVVKTLPDHSPVFQKQVTRKEA